MSYRFSPIQSVSPLFILMKEQVIDSGISENDWRATFDEMAAAHTAGERAPGIQDLTNQTDKYQTCGVKLWGHKLVYQVRPPADLAIVNIKLSSWA
jgi:hypothetical protein